MNKKKSGTIQQTVWNKIKSKDDFIKFCNMLIENGLDVKQLELIYSYEELVQMYADWKINSMRL